jgi:PEP-CTERM motif
MRTNVKPSVAFAAGAIILTNLLCGQAQAQSILIESGTSYLSDIFGSGPTSAETLQVSWFVTENTSSSIYTYAYNVYNPVGDVALNNNGTPTTTPETVNTFNLSFPVPTGAGVFFQATPPAGGSVQNNGPDGLTYTFPDIQPGQWSPLLAYQTSVDPAMVNASADGGSVPPGPWSNIMDNSPVPAPSPRQVPEPTTATLLGLGALGMLRRFVRRS